jgi:murein L,D-transpeptidase YcbB/YkuD
VKFLFPNEYNIYLHDTPAKNLFAQPVRAFSHGCIRIQEPIKLAKYLLQNDPEWPEEKIMAAMDRDAEEQVTLKEKIPVFIAYFTAFVDTEGRIHFREDIYKHDKKLGELLRLDN